MANLGESRERTVARHDNDSAAAPGAPGHDLPSEERPRHPPADWDSNMSREIQSWGLILGLGDILGGARDLVATYNLGLG